MDFFKRVKLQLDRLSPYPRLYPFRMTGPEIAVFDKAIKQEKRKSQRKSLVKFSTDFLPIDMVHDASGFVDKLFSKLRSTNERYEVKLYLLRLISRMIGRHKI